MDDRGQRSVREVAAEASSAVTRSSGAIVFSLVAHGLFVGALVALPAGLARREIAHEIEIELIQPTTIQVPDEPEPVAPEPVLEPAPRTEPHVTPQPTTGAVISTTSPVVPGTVGEVVVAAPEIQMPTIGPEVATDPQREREEQARLAALVAPGRAASSWVVAGATGPSQPSGPAGLTATGGRPRLATEAEVEGSLQGHLRGQAMARPWLTRTEPSLTPRPDGSLEYRGHAFTARIAPDGAVSFSDRDAVQADEMLQGGPARFDLTDMAMRGAGQDPYAAEREWFMEHTEEVRARLETEARSRERDAALRGVPGRLASIWNQERPAFIRRRAIFRMWDDCDEQGDGLNVRRQVLEFVRTQIPQSSTDAFTVEELRRFNGERDSTMEFDPY